jgi:hypothetical protein
MDFSSTFYGMILRKGGYENKQNKFTFQGCLRGVLCPVFYIYKEDGRIGSQSRCPTPDPCLDLLNRVHVEFFIIMNIFMSSFSYEKLNRVHVEFFNLVITFHQVMINLVLTNII